MRSGPIEPPVWPAITVLKPLCGDEALLEEALASYCGQDYPVFQIVFGVQSARDPAVDTVRRLRLRFPEVEIALVVDGTRHGRNNKIGNLLNMIGAARHDLLVISDSDIHAPADTLRSIAQALARPKAGLATTLYTGMASSQTLTGALGAAQINHSFLPGALMARSLGRQDCLGAVMALERATLERIGGLAALSDHLADDALLGQLVRDAGLDVVLASAIPATTVPETRLAGADGTRVALDAYGQIGGPGRLRAGGAAVSAVLGRADACGWRRTSGGPGRCSPGCGRRGRSWRNCWTACCRPRGDCRFGACRSAMRCRWRRWWRATGPIVWPGAGNEYRVTSFTQAAQQRGTFSQAAQQRGTFSEAVLQPGKG